MFSVIKRVLFSIIVLPSGAIAETPMEGQRNDYPFQCGATFALMAEVHRKAGEMENSERYRSKFATLAVEAEKQFAKAGRSADEAETYMQKHVDGLASLADGNAKVVIDFARKCDQLFP